jgi:hypothetical protein
MHALQWSALPLLQRFLQFRTTLIDGRPCSVPRRKRKCCLSGVMPLITGRDRSGHARRGVMSRNAEERRGGAGVERRAAADRDGVYDLDRDSSERLIFRPLDEKAPVWAPDGHSMYYRSDGAGGPPNVFRWTSEAEGGKVYYGGAGVQEPQDVSRDGKWLLFVNARQGGAGDMNVLPLSPSGPAQPFVATHFDELSPPLLARRTLGRVSVRCVRTAGSLCTAV